MKAVTLRLTAVQAGLVVKALTRRALKISALAEDAVTDALISEQAELDEVIGSIEAAVECGAFIGGDQ